MNKSKKSSIVHSLAIEKEISILKAQANHLIKYMANQVNALTNDKLKNDLENVEDYDGN